MKSQPCLIEKTGFWTYVMEFVRIPQKKQTCFPDIQLYITTSWERITDNPTGCGSLRFIDFNIYGMLRSSGLEKKHVHHYFLKYRSF